MVFKDGNNINELLLSSCNFVACMYDCRWPCCFLLTDYFFNRDPSIVALLFALSFEWSKAGSYNRIHSLFERALADDKLQKSVLLWRCYLAYEAEIACNTSAARRVFFRAIHACPWYVSHINMDIRA